MVQRFLTKNKSCFYMTNTVTDRCVMTTFSLYRTSYNRMPFMKMTGGIRSCLLKALILTLTQNNQKNYALIKKFWGRMELSCNLCFQNNIQCSYSDLKYHIKTLKLYEHCIQTVMYNVGELFKSEKDPLSKPKYQQSDQLNFQLPNKINF